MVRRSHVVPWVVLDSTVFGGKDRYLEGPAGRLLCDESAAGRLRIAVPEVVLLESEANHRRSVRAAQDELSSARETLEQLRAPQGHDIRPRRLQYRADLEQILRETRGEVLPIPDVPHVDLVKKAVARRRPFDLKGDGYRDALVWESVLVLLERDSEPVVLISDDRAAFSKTKDAAELATELGMELRKRNHDGRVELYFEVSHYTAELPKARELVRTWRMRSIEDTEFRTVLTKRLVEGARRDGAAVLALNFGAGNIRNPRVVSIDNPRNLRVEEASVRSSDGGALLDVTLEVDYALEFETILARPPDQLQEQPSWSTVTLTSAASLAFYVRYDADEPSRLSVNLKGMAPEKPPARPH